MCKQPNLRDRLMSRVKITKDCWIWTGLMFTNGYGQIRMPRGIATTTHRASWIVHRGPIPKGLCVCHHCDNRKCVNPKHLFLGTQYENLRDMVAKGRQNKNKGEQCWCAKLTPAKVRTIRRLNKSGIRQGVLAKRFGVTFQTISDVVLRKSWFHIPEDTEVSNA